jgi:hypothetical protein
VELHEYVGRLHSCVMHAYWVLVLFTWADTACINSSNRISNLVQFNNKPSVGGLQKFGGLFGQPTCTGPYTGLSGGTSAFRGETLGLPRAISAHCTRVSWVLGRLSAKSHLPVRWCREETRASSRQSLCREQRCLCRKPRLTSNARFP